MPGCLPTHRPRNRTHLSTCSVSAVRTAGNLCSPRPAGFQCSGEQGDPPIGRLRRIGPLRSRRERCRQLPSQPEPNHYRSGLQRSTRRCARKCQCCTRPSQRPSGRSASRFPLSGAALVAARPGAAVARLRGTPGGPGLCCAQQERFEQEQSSDRQRASVSGSLFQPNHKGSVHASSFAAPPCQYKDKSTPPWRGLSGFSGKHECFPHLNSEFRVAS